MSTSRAPVFEALIVPYRSLSRTGGAAFVGVVAVISGGLMLRLWLLGAWPAAILSLIEVPLLALLLLVNWRRARASELIMLTDEKFIVIRTDPAGRRQEATLPSAWLRVDLQAADMVPHVILSSRGRALEIGAFLHEPEKRSLFEALRNALDRLQNPRFDNPQLRDG